MRVLSPGLIAALVVSVVPAVGQAADSERARLNAQLDIDNSKQLERAEVMLGLKNLRTRGGINLPKIKETGKLPEGLLEDEKLLDRYEIFVLTQKAPPPYALTAVDPAEFGLAGELRQGPSEKEILSRRYNPTFNINLRRETKNLFKALEDPYAQGALFSYSQDYLSGEEQMAAKGVLGISYSLVENPKYRIETDETPDGKAVAAEKPASPFLRNFESLFTFEFDRLKTSKPDTEGTDKLAFGLHFVADLFLGQSAELANRRMAAAAKAEGREVDFTAFQDPIVRSLLVDLSAQWATDSNFNRNIQSVSLDVTPYFKFHGFGRFGHLGGGDDPKKEWLSYRLSLTGHLEAGTVAEPGKPNLSDEFTRAGGRGTGEFLIAPGLLEERLSAELSYLYYHGFGSDSHTVRQFKVSGQYVLGWGTGIFGVQSSGARAERKTFTALRVEFVNGTTPITLEDEKSLLIGLGVSF
ncbi:MAG TPA: hypothetical protein VK633_04220 [Verrucomicrobiae bacterium]|nr:hypothetical protein [Verrucomicrobiae bacterium]